MLNDFAFVEGGASKVALTSAEALASRGHDVTLVVGVGTQNPFGEAIRFETAAGQSTRANPNRLNAALEGIWNPSTHRLVSDVLAACGDQTIFHIHTWTKALSNSMLHLIKERRSRVIVTLHDFFTACPNGGFYNYPSEHVCELRPMSRACICTNCDARSYQEKLWRVGRQFVQNRISGFPKWCKHYVTLSPLSLEYLKPWLPADATFYAVPNPVVKPLPAPIDSSANSAFLMVGRLAPEKGPMIFARAAEIAGVQARFVGDGPESSAVSHLNPGAELSGWLEEGRLGDEYGKARALVFPSRWIETAGLTVLEAASCGVPAVVSDVCAARDLIGNDQRGLIFRDGDVDDLADKLTQLNGDDQLVRRLGSAAYAGAQMWAPTPDRHAELLEDVYRNILAN